MPAASPEDPFPLDNDQPLNIKIITHRFYQACLVYSRANLVVELMKPLSGCSHLSSI